MLLRVGQSALRGDVARYARQFDLFELKAEPGRFPRTARLKEWRARVPASFVFSVALPRAVCALEQGADVEDALSRALAAVEALDAAWLVLQTPPSVTPGTRNRQRLEEVVQKLLERGRVAWEPRGLWEDDDAEAFAQELGVALVRDLGRSDPPDQAVIYTRLRGIGDGGAVRTGAVEQAAESLEDCDEAYVVVEGSGAVRAARVLRQMLGTSEPGMVVEEEADT